MNIKDIEIGGRHFSKVKKAREVLKAHAEEIYTEYRQAIRFAVAAGEYEAALKGYQHLMDHMPKEEEDTLLDPSIDKKAVDSGNSGPVIQIGVSLGGVTPKQKQLEPVIIDVNPK